MPAPLIEKEAPDAFGCAYAKDMAAKTTMQRSMNLLETTGIRLHVFKCEFKKNKPKCEKNL